MDRIAQLQALLKENPNDNFLHHALALEQIKRNDVAAAKKEFLFNLTAAPDYLPTYYHIGKLEEKSGNHEEAMRYYEQGIALAARQNDNHARGELQAAYDELAY